jgi:hypothetical protein
LNQAQNIKIHTAQTKEKKPSIGRPIAAQSQSKEIKTPTEDKKIKNKNNSNFAQSQREGSQGRSS